MKETRVASRYARSLIQLARSESKMEEVRSDMLKVDEVVGANRDLEIMLNSPVIKADKKAKVLDMLFGDMVSSITHRFMQILVNKGREHLIHEIAEEVEKQYLESQGIVKVEVVSSIPLDEAQRTAVMQTLNSLDANKVELEEKVDPELIGGFVITVGDKQLDHSVAARLRDFRSQFQKNHYVPGF